MHERPDEYVLVFLFTLEIYTYLTMTDCFS